MKLNLINIETFDKELIISYDCCREIFEIGLIYKPSLTLVIEKVNNLELQNIRKMVVDRLR